MDEATKVFANFMANAMSGRTGKCVMCDNEGSLSYTVKIKDKETKEVQHEIKVFLCLDHVLEELMSDLQGIPPTKEKAEAIGKLVLTTIKGEKNGKQDGSPTGR